MTGNSHIGYMPLEDMGTRMREVMHRCAWEGTPRPGSLAIRVHSAGAFWAFADSLQASFRDGVCDHAIKDLCGVYISRTVKCEFCGNQRSTKATTAGLVETQYDELLNFEASDKYDVCQKAALAYAEAIAWGLNSEDLWRRLHRSFSEEELVELGCFIALTFGQQSWIRLLGIDHNEYMPGSDASMAPGFESADAASASKASPDYWAETNAGGIPSRQ